MKSDIFFMYRNLCIPDTFSNVNSFGYGNAFKGTISFVSMYSVTESMQCLYWLRMPISIGMLFASGV